MNKQNLSDLVRFIVESVNKEMNEMWMSTNEAGLTSENREVLKGIVKECLDELMGECGGDITMQHDEPLPEKDAME